MSGCQYEDAFARNTDPQTSHDAAARAMSKVSLLEYDVIGQLQRGGPQTTGEIAAKAEISLVSISPRMKPLEKKGLVLRTDSRRRGSIVWTLTMAGCKFGRTR